MISSRTEHCALIPARNGRAILRIMRNLDGTDLRLLGALAQDPRRTVVALAQKLGLSRNTVQARMSHLGAGAGIPFLPAADQSGRAGLSAGCLHPHPRASAETAADHRRNGPHSGGAGSLRRHRAGGHPGPRGLGGRGGPVPDQRNHPGHRRRRADRHIAGHARADPVPDRATASPRGTRPAG